MRAAVRTAVVLAVMCALLVTATISAPTAHAQSSFDDDRVDFGGVNNTALTVRAVGDQVWVGGEFTQAFNPDHTTTFARSNLAVFDFNTGELLPRTFDTNEKVKAIESDDATTVWVAGNFTEIAGQTVTYVAAFDAITGEFDDSFSVTLDNEVNALHYNDGWLYIGGEFRQINSLNYDRFARINAFTGELDTSFQPNPDAPVRSIDTFGDRVYAAGLFEEVGKSPDNYARRWVAGFDVDSGQPAGPDFPFDALRPGEGAHRAGLWRVHVSPDGNHIYTADSRNVVIKWDRTTGQELWDRRAQGDIQDVETDGDSVYIGTHEGFLADGDQRLLVALNAADGSSDDNFQPLLNSFFGTYDITLSQGALIAVGDFTTVNGVSSPHLAVFHGPGWSGAQPLTPSYTVGDVSCNSVPDLGDALLIAQFSVGFRTEAASCAERDPLTQIGPGGDVNNDGVIDIGDALLVAQCSVGYFNSFCPR